MAKKKVTCPECEGTKVKVQETTDSFWVGGQEVTEIIEKYFCPDCGYEWEKKSGS